MSLAIRRVVEVSEREALVEGGEMIVATVRQSPSDVGSKLVEAMRDWSSTDESALAVTRYHSNPFLFCQSQSRRNFIKRRLPRYVK